jgi:hypothetical protein
MKSVLALLAAPLATLAAHDPRDPRGLRAPRRAADPVQCAYPTDKGCGRLTWPVTWSMRESLYTYCYINCPLDYFDKHRELGVFGGVVGVDHYWTHQGMPCVNGVPQEFEAQDAFARATKASFPGTRILQYRITDAVPYTKVVHDAMVEHPDWFVRWHHEPNSNGSICVVPPEAQTGRPGDNCSWPIQAAAYDFSNPIVRDWFQENIIKPVMVAGDGVWLDGDGPDNGAYQCSGNYDWGRLPAPYPALNASEVDSFCAGENMVQEAAHDFMFANGGMDGQACWTFIDDFPKPADSPSACAQKMLSIDHRQTDNGTPVAFASDRCGGNGGYNDDTAMQTIAAFQLARDEYWFFGLNWENTLNDTIAALLLTDYGLPLGNMTNSTPFLFERQFAKATVALDCATFTASFTPA